ncbi:MAG: AAA family ATPase, partial [Lachnospiraceae bacterium]|nr:AAA family ATPase [Lachnospiraceae bacterium]
MALDGSKKRIDDGNPDFRSLVTDNGLYIDKTRYIKELEDIGKFNLVLRPKRFGKSLFTSMLMYYYDAEYKDEFDKLFGGLYIHEHKTQLANSYNVLKFDFSGISSDPDRLENGFVFAVRLALESLIRSKKLGFALDKNITTADQLIRAFLSMYKSVTDTKLYLLIDEYDNFANAVLGENFNFFKDITSKSGFVRTVYEVFKEYSGNILDRVYITGVTPITLDALASGFNYVINRSLDPRLSDIIGFTEDEVSCMVDYYGIDALHKDALREYYDGYLFNNAPGSHNKVYNSTLVFYYLAYLIGTDTPPVNLIDARVQSDPGTVRKLIDLYHDDEEKLKILDAIESREPLAASIVLKFESESFMESRDDLISMLYYLG